MKNRKNTVYNLVIYTIIILLAVVFMYPIINMISKSLFTQKELVQLPSKFVPKIPQWKNYPNALKESGYYKGIPMLIVYFLNTILVLVLVTAGGVLTCSMCAYGFSKINFKGRDKIFFLVLATMMIPGSVMTIPLFIIFKNLHWLNTFLPLWVPAWFGGGAINIFMLRQFMKSIPNALIESAKIDGANHWQIYSKIVMPNCIPVLVVITINYFMSTWNDLMSPLLYINDKTKWTLSLGITSMGQGVMGGHEHDNLLMAACVMMSIPPIIIFYFGQDYFIDNVIISGIKE